MLSSLCADQCPKSNGRELPFSKGRYDELKEYFDQNLKGERYFPKSLASSGSGLKKGAILSGILSILLFSFSFMFFEKAWFNSSNNNKDNDKDILFIVILLYDFFSNV